MSYRRIYTWFVSIYISSAGKRRLTLAKKFDVVQRKTVTRSKNMPKVRRATFASPMLALNPPDLKVACDRKEDIDSLSSCSSDLLSGTGNPLGSAVGAKGSCVDILFLSIVVVILRYY